MTRALQFLMLWSIAFGIAGCRHPDPEAQKAAQLGIPPEQNRKMMHDSPLYRYLVEDGHDYKTETRRFLERIQTKTTPEQLQAWARSVLATHQSDENFWLPSNSIPRFILDLDPPLGPSGVYVVSHSHVTIAWLGGFESWGLVVGDSKVMDDSKIYSIQWVPGIYAIHDLQ